MLFIQNLKNDCETIGILRGQAPSSISPLNLDYFKTWTDEINMLFIFPHDSIHAILHVLPRLYAFLLLELEERTC